MNNKYPRIGGFRNAKKGRCLFCGGNKANKLIDIEINEFRGDDDVFKLHEWCYRGMSRKNLLKKIVGIAYANMEEG